MGSCSELRLGVDCFLKSHLCCRGDVVLGVPVGEFTLVVGLALC